jgi:rhodanese-related sulfurtransferase
MVAAHGESSSLAAAQLVDLGVDAGDLIGGYAAW